METEMEKMKKQPLFLFFLLSILPSIAQSKTCPPCGATPVPYPLSTSPLCGDQSYKIRCSSNNSLFFDALNSSSYPITSISPLSQRLVIKPAPFLSSSQCVTTDLRSQGIQLDPTLPFNVTSSNTIMLLNCTQELLLSPLNCSANSLCHLYAASPTSDAAACRNIPICCTFVAGGSSTSYAVRASGTGCSAYRSFVSLDSSVPVDTWRSKAGVELEWATPREPICGSQKDCEDGGNATCTADGGTGVKRCFCVQGLSWNPFAGACVNGEY